MFFEVVNYSRFRFHSHSDGPERHHQCQVDPDQGRRPFAAMDRPDQIRPRSHEECRIRRNDPGPPDITETDPTTGKSFTPYANLLFAVSRTGDLYALGLTTDASGKATAVAKQGIFVDGKTSVTIGGSLTTVSGLAFSTLDVNMWHSTTSLHAQDGHDLNATYDESRVDTLGPLPDGGTSFYFGKGETETAAGNYDAPGGAYGSLITDPFSLAEYSASDVPTLYFDYLLDNGNVQNYDTARVFASDDGVTWRLLGATLSNPNGDLASTVGSDGKAVWRQFRLTSPSNPAADPAPTASLTVYTWSLADFAGDDNIRLRFDFSTAGDMHVGDFGNTLNTTGAYLGALSGESLEDGDQFVVDSLDGKSQKTFEFDMGIALYLQDVAGNAISDGDTFTITGLQGTSSSKTFEFDSDGSLNVSTSRGDSHCPGTNDHGGRPTNRLHRQRPESQKLHRSKNRCRRPRQPRHAQRRQGGQRQ